VLHLAKRQHRGDYPNSLDRYILSLAKARLDTVDGGDGYGDRGYGDSLPNVIPAFSLDILDSEIAM
jgi:hypothetical protein